MEKLWSAANIKLYSGGVDDAVVKSAHTRWLGVRTPV
jgi:hypothetical protein